MKTLLRWTAPVLLTVAFFGCSGPQDQGGDTQTNWLGECNSDAQCGTLSCRCGVCTRPCTADRDCDGAPADVSCRAADSVETLAQCPAGAGEGLCLPPSDAPTSTPATFCEDYVGALCEHVGDCECPEEARTTCAASLASCADPEGAFAVLEASVAAGDMIFDATAAKILVTRLKAPSSSCGAPVAAAGLDSYTTHTLGGVYRGTQPAGSPCAKPESKKGASPSPCEPGLICLKGADGTNTCVPLAPPGEPCPVLGDNPSSSCLERQAPDRDGEFETAFAGLTCVPDAPGSATGTCRTAAPDGSPCDRSSQCAGGRCDLGSGSGAGACAQKLDAGSVCALDDDCASGRCDGGSPGACAPQLPDGSNCARSPDCSSGSCNFADGMSGLGTCGPKPVSLGLPKGSACTRSDDCETSLLCAPDMTCRARVCEDFIQ